MSKAQTKTDQSSEKPRRLGRGLSALLGDPVAVQVSPQGSASSLVSPVVEAKPGRAESAGVMGAGVAAVDGGGGAGGEGDGGHRVVHVPCGAIVPSPFQPRRVFDEQSLEELAASIRSAGVVQPILVRALGPGRADGKAYELVAGERRWRASVRAGVAHVPAVVATLSDEQAAEWALIENVQRADLSPMEKAWAVRGLSERFALSHAQVGEKLGIDRSSVSNLIRLTELEPAIIELMESQALSFGHGKALLAAAPGPHRVKIATLAANQSWSVRRLEQAIARIGESAEGPAPAVQVSEAAMRDLEKQLGEHLGTSVRIRAGAGGKRGTIVVKFYGLDHFDGLMSKMGFVLR